MALPVLQPIPGLDLCPRALPRGWALLSGMLCRACDLAPTAVTACFGQIQPAASLFALFFFFFFFLFLNIGFSTSSSGGRSPLHLLPPHVPVSEGWGPSFTLSAKIWGCLSAQGGRLKDQSREVKARCRIWLWPLCSFQTSFSPGTTGGGCSAAPLLPLLWYFKQQHPPFISLFAGRRSGGRTEKGFSALILLLFNFFPLPSPINCHKPTHSLAWGAESHGNGSVGFSTCRAGPCSVLGGKGRL